MTIVELCDPLFQYICRLSRMGRANTKAELPVVRAQVTSLLAEIAEKAGKDVKLAAQYRRLELPLIFFVDSMIVESKLNISTEWHANRLAFERNELAGDDKFFDLLEEALADTSAEASDVLAVYYVCLGLGFTGSCVGQPEQLRKYQSSMFPRIRQLIDSDETARICKECYEHVDSRDLRQPPGLKMLWILAVFLGIVCSFLLFYYWTYRDATGELRRSSSSILEQDRQPVRAFSP